MCRLYSTVQLVEQNENKTLEKTHVYMCMFCGSRGTRGRSKEQKFAGMVPGQTPRKECFWERRYSCMTTCSDGGVTESENPELIIRLGD